MLPSSPGRCDLLQAVPQDTLSVPVAPLAQGFPMTHPDTQARAVLVLENAFDKAATTCGTKRHAAHLILKALHDAGLKVVVAVKAKEAA